MNKEEFHKNFEYDGYSTQVDDKIQDSLIRFRFEKQPFTLSLKVNIETGELIHWFIAKGFASLDDEVFEKVIGLFDEQMLQWIVEIHNNSLGFQLDEKPPLFLIEEGVPCSVEKWIDFEPSYLREEEYISDFMYPDEQELDSGKHFEVSYTGVDATDVKRISQNLFTLCLTVSKHGDMSFFVTYHFQNIHKKDEIIEALNEAKSLLFLFASGVVGVLV